jgi:hypothetical protein
LWGAGAPGDWDREERKKSWRGGGSQQGKIRPPPPFFSFLSLFYLFFCRFLVMLFSWGFLRLGVFFSNLLFLFCITEVCIYSVRVPSRVRNKISIKLILFFEVWIWLRIKFESG